MKSAARLGHHHPARPQRVIDVHAHVGLARTPSWLGTSDVGRVLARAHAAGIDLSIVSHLDVLYDVKNRWRKANEELLRECERRKGILMWWVLDPRNARSVALARAQAGHPKIVGLKVGPTYHKYRFIDRASTILDLARETNWAVLTHSGQENDLPIDIVPCVNRYPDVRFIVAHFGNCLNFEGHVKAFRKCTSPHCFVDTSSYISIYADLIERGVRLLGKQRFLFGTDTPLYSAAAQFARVLGAEITAAERKAILGDNAWKRLLSAENRRSVGG